MSRQHSALGIGARIASLMAVLIWLGLTPKAGFAAEKTLLSNVRAPYVHVLTLYDAGGRAISPSQGDTTPFSMEATCAKCHDIGAIRTGWHFDAWTSRTAPGRPGEPWLVIDYQTATQIPVSARGWEGTWQPKALGLSKEAFLQEFGRHFPGDGLKTEEHSPFEMDCMACHAAGQEVYLPNERKTLSEAADWVVLPLRQLRLGEVQQATHGVGGATNSGAADPFANFDPANEGGGATDKLKFLYDKTRFDANDRVLLPIVRQADDESCLFCHTSIQHQSDITRTGWQHDRDVHSQAGMRCTDCHRHGIDHKVVRGFAGEARDPAIASLSCRGCHYGPEPDSAAGRGRFGSPLPGHEGFPPIHFEVMSCTACHSGPMPRIAPTLLETSMAHGLGFAEFGRERATVPFISGPVFLEGADGKIAPHKVLWPAFWAWRTGEKLTPVLPAEVLKLTNLGQRPADREHAEPLQSEEIKAGLEALARAGGPDRVPVYVAAGLMHVLEENQLTTRTSAAAELYAWPLAHDVRPAGQSLGSTGCTDCHAVDAPFLAAGVAPNGPTAGGTPAARRMGELMGLDMGYQRLLGVGLPAKGFLLMALGLFCGVTLLRGGLWLSAILFSSRRGRS